MSKFIDEEATPRPPLDRDDIVWSRMKDFTLVHLACLGVIWSGVTVEAVELAAVSYVVRMWAICAGFHRYFSHRAFSTSRGFQLFLAVLAQTTGQNSALWWAMKHREHHRLSDRLDDIHSPRRHGFIYSHFGWVFARGQEDLDRRIVRDLAKFPELLWLHKHDHIPTVALGFLSWLIAGWPGLFVGFFCSTVAVYHATFCINSVAHVWGSRPFVTGDDSRNNFFLTMITLGEGWHNNHHAYQWSARQGFRAWQIDVTWLTLVALSRVGLVWDLKPAPPAIMRGEYRPPRRIVEIAASDLVERLNQDVSWTQTAEGAEVALRAQAVSMFGDGAGIEEVIAAARSRLTQEQATAAPAE